MLLRSITKHVKDQNWFAVGLDFFIVVSGILIAFQITNWSEARAQQAREEVLLTRLQADFEPIVQFGERLMPKLSSQPAGTRQLIDSIRKDVKLEVDTDFQAMVEASVTIWAPFRMSQTYEEMVATATLSRVRNPELRRALSAYAGLREGDFLLLDRQMGIRDAGIIEQAIQFRVHDTDYAETLFVEALDWEELKLIEPHLQILLKNQLLRHSWQKQALARAQEIVTLLEEEISGDAAPKATEPLN